ncbi:MAG: HlyD family efflux transporter periplasmic adaptor subunit [Myxococcota bacterium]
MNDGEDLFSHTDVARRVAAVVILVTAICALAATAALVGIRTDVVVAEPATLVASEGTVSVRAPSAGAVRDVAVADGATVHAGDLLVALDSDEAQVCTSEAGERIALLEERRALVEARLQLQGDLQGADAVRADRQASIGRAALDAARAEADSASAATAASREQLGDVASLFERGIVSDVDRTAAELQASRAQAAEARARAELASREEGLAVGEADAVQARATSALRALDDRAELVTIDLELARTRRERDECALAAERASIRAPVDGQVFDLRVRRHGERVDLGAPLLGIVPLDVTMAAEIEAGPDEVPFLVEGLAASISLDAYPFREFGLGRGHVAQVDRAPGPGGRFRVRVAVDAWPSFPEEVADPLRPGLTGRVMVTGRERWLLVLLRPLPPSSRGVRR